ncbi:MAG: phosphatase PAP2 family protein [Gemmatimonadaceae bacterium]|nr:phosphatase PAP2 family protein [Gemmatimonadaceae bacterium]
MRKKLLQTAACAAISFAVCSPLAAQSRASDTAIKVSRSTVPLVRSSDLIFLGGAGAVFVGAMSADRSIQRSFQSKGTQGNSGLRHLSDATGFYGDPGSVLISAGLYFSGLGTHSRRLAALGMHTGESVIFGGGLAEGIKGGVGRARPKFSPNDSRFFRSGKGYSNDDFASFPSGETAAAFAASTALALGINRDWPGHSRVVTPVAYTAAALVGYSRLYKNAHWASDVVAGATLGTASAVFVDRFNRRYTDNVFERWFLPTSLVPKRRGLAMAWSR